MKKKKVYISGQITGLEKTAYMTLFEIMEGNIKKAGYEPVSPVRYTEFENPDDMEWSDFMRRDIKMLCDCDYICLLPNWKKSKGARLEATIADQLGIPCINLREKNCGNCCFYGGNTDRGRKENKEKNFCMKSGEYTAWKDLCDEWDY